LPTVYYRNSKPIDDIVESVLNGHGTFSRLYRKNSGRIVQLQTVVPTSANASCMPCLTKHSQKDVFLLISGDWDQREGKGAAGWSVNRQ
jgi:hypothetical protein